jgi:hypothetical protein
MTRHFLEEWFAGKRSAAQLQQACAAYMKTHPLDYSEALRVLSGIGTSGAWPTHCDRDLHRLCMDIGVADVPDLYMARITFREKIFKDGILAIKQRDHPCILPHEWFASLYKHPVLWAKLVTGEADELSLFWEREATWPDQFRFPEGLDRSRAYPFSFHGDDAGLFVKEKICVLEMHSFLPTPDTPMERLLFTVVPYSDMVGEQTLHEIMEVLEWSFQACWTGKHPEYDHMGCPWADGDPRKQLAGTDIAGGAVFPLIFFEGDWKFQKETFRLRAYHHNQMCHLCSASKVRDGHLYTDLSINAQWKFNYTTFQSYLDDLVTNDVPICPIARVPAFSLWRVPHVCRLCIIICLQNEISIQYAPTEIPTNSDQTNAKQYAPQICIDSMHCLDLGMGGYMLGCCFATVCKQGHFGVNISMTVRLERLYADYAKWCKDNGVTSRLQMFTVDRVAQVCLWFGKNGPIC